MQHVQYSFFRIHFGRYKETDYARFREERAMAASMGEEDVYFGVSSLLCMRDGTVVGRHELDDTLHRDDT